MCIFKMGLGKTLTSISVVWAFARKEQCKSIIICPCSLLDNWKKEIKHWLGFKVNPLIIKPGGDDAEIMINTFTISRISKYPILVISYEMFRKYSLLINKVPKLELMICDEGHRLKNVGGTKTIQALTNCKAFRRIILSGTPIQNDLDELFSIVSFVVPGYLGTLQVFKNTISNPITLANESNASIEIQELGQQAITMLQQLLSNIMLRRTQKDILTNILPKRTDYVIYCGMNMNQEIEYNRIAHQIKSSLNISSIPNDINDEHDAEEAYEMNIPIQNSSFILPALMNLRQVCSNYSGTTTSALVIPSINTTSVIKKVSFNIYYIFKLFY